jgi:acetylornithine aminotransferase
MIGIVLPEELKEVKKNLLFKHKIFTGEAKPNIIRLLPALNITKVEADIFIKAIRAELNP